MASANAQLRELFDRQRVRIEEWPGWYVVCPICLGVWPEEKLLVKKNAQKYLSREHAPQRQTGRDDLQCITCGKCNHERWYENPRQQQMGAQDAAVLSDLVAAYIIAFASMGYSYILDTALNRTRWRIIKGKSAATCALFDRSKLFSGFDLVAGDRHILLPAVAEEPVVLVVFPDGHFQSDAGKTVHCVILPRPGSSGRLDGYQERQEVFPIPTELSESVCWEDHGLVPRAWDRCVAHDHEHPVSEQTWRLRPDPVRSHEWQPLGHLIHDPMASSGRVVL